ncbi:MAG: hypothetical protein OXD35_09915 [Thiotrichales bacterium]|nr:hypothetical protein [Thiotrichales bacterium]
MRTPRRNLPARLALATAVKALQASVAAAMTLDDEEKEGYEKRIETAKKRSRLPGPRG